MRAAWQCDCHGEPAPIRTAKRGNGLGRVVLETWLPVLSELTGDEPPYCPWRAYWEPIVVEALSLRGRLEHVDLDAQPAVVVAAMEHLASVQSRIENDDRKAAAKSREAAAKMNGQR